MKYLIIAVLLTACGSDIKKVENHTTAAYLTSQDYVKARLSNPEEADFDWTPEFDELEGDNNYRIVGHVVTKNAFGVKAKLRFVCVLHYKGGDDNEAKNWDLVTIDVN